jgi:GNAT superfamily N-acetyltransferase
MSLTFKLVRVPGGHGADDYEPDEGLAYTLLALEDSRQVGKFDFNLQDRRRTIWVRWIEVPIAAQRRGIGTALINEALRRYPSATIDTGGWTDEGSGFWTKLFGSAKRYH